MFPSILLFGLHIHSIREIVFKGVKISNILQYLCDNLVEISTKLSEALRRKDTLVLVDTQSGNYLIILIGLSDYFASGHTPKRKEEEKVLTKAHPA